MKVITTKLSDHNKGDVTAPNYRARLVGREVAYDKRDDLYAATPPLESLKAVLALCASRQEGSRPSRVMALDVVRVYFYAPATRAVYIQIPPEDRLPGDEGFVAKLNLSFYGPEMQPQTWPRPTQPFQSGRIRDRQGQHLQLLPPNEADRDDRPWR